MLYEQGVMSRANDEQFFVPYPVLRDITASSDEKKTSMNNGF